MTTAWAVHALGRRLILIGAACATLVVVAAASPGIIGTAAASAPCNLNSTGFASIGTQLGIDYAGNTTCGTALPALSSQASLYLNGSLVQSGNYASCSGSCTVSNSQGSYHPVSTGAHYEIDYTANMTAPSGFVWSGSDPNCSGYGTTVATCTIRIVGTYPLPGSQQGINLSLATA